MKRTVKRFISRPLVQISSLLAFFIEPISLLSIRLLSSCYSPVNSSMKRSLFTAGLVFSRTFSVSSFFSCLKDLSTGSFLAKTVLDLAEFSACLSQVYVHPKQHCQPFADLFLFFFIIIISSFLQMNKEKEKRRREG